MKTLSDIRNEVLILGTSDPDWADKMVHPVPDAPVVDRVMFILEHCREKRVINTGSDSGELHSLIKEVAASLVGIDKKPGPRTDIELDLNYSSGAHLPEADIIVCGEVLEHLSCPGNALDLFWRAKCKLLVTVPNISGRAYQKRHGTWCEIVNSDHVAWYSHYTLTRLLTRHGFTIEEFCWYNGSPFTAEGIIVTASPG